MISLKRFFANLTNTRRERREANTMAGLRNIVTKFDDWTEKQLTAYYYRSKGNGYNSPDYNHFMVYLMKYDGRFEDAGIEELRSLLRAGIELGIV